MSEEKPLNNPFAALDKKQFRPAPEKKRGRVVAAPPQEPAVPTVAASEDDLFLDAMRSVAPLDAAGKAKKGQAGKAPHQREGLSALEVPPLREIRKAASKRDSGPETGNVEQPLLVRREKGRLQSRDAVDRAHAASPARDAVEDETLFFASAMRDVAPLPGKGREVLPETPPPSPPAVEEHNPMQDFMEGKLEFTLASTDEYVEGHVLGLDLLIVGKLQAGQFSPEAHLDLHGLNALQAFQSLVGFIRGAYLKGQRTVLVVPGRGHNSPSGMGVLREKVQNWFTQEPFRRVVLAFCTAKSTDGGAGALYVLLRKFRKDRGKVYWDRRPADPDLL